MLGYVSMRTDRLRVATYLGYRKMLLLHVKESRSVYVVYKSRPGQSALAITQSSIRLGIYCFIPMRMAQHTEDYRFIFEVDR